MTKETKDIESATEAELMTVRQAAERLGITVKAVYARLDAQQMQRRFMLGGALVVLRSEVEDWQAERIARFRILIGG